MRRDAGLEGRFQKKWAHEKGAQDRAVLAFFILVLLCIEIGSPLLGSAIDVSCYGLSLSTPQHSSV